MVKSSDRSETIYDPNTKIWSGPQSTSRFTSDHSIARVLLECLQKKPEVINQICCDSGKQYTNREILEKSISVSIHFKKLGFVQGDVVGVCATNSDFLAPLVIGAFATGLIINPLAFEKDLIKHMFSITTPAIIFCDGVIYDRVKESCTEIDCKAVVYTLADHITGVPNINEFLTETFVVDDYRPEPLHQANTRQIAMILCSSGTTGPSKGICVTHAGLLSLAISDFFTADDRALSFSLLYWVSGIVSLVSSIQNGLTRLITRKNFDAELCLDLIEQYKATLILSPPEQMAALSASPTIHKRDLSAVKSYITGGCTISTALMTRIKQFFRHSSIVLGYGMSEMPAFGITAGYASENGNTGKLVNNVELKIIDDDGKCLGPNESGEILARSTILSFAGYYRKPEATAQCCDSEGWIHTGDIGFINENYEVFVVDRKKDILKFMGNHLSPSEIENVIMQLPEVAAVCVIGIPNDFYNYLPAAMIVLKFGSSLRETDVKQYVAERMSSFKQLRGGVYFVEEIPKTPSGKNMRRKVTEICKKLLGEYKE